MALIDCPECGRQVSDRAPACPACGYPRQGQAKAPVHRAVQTIELTGKRWKALQLVSVMVMLLGLALGIAGHATLLVVLCVPGLIGLVVARVGMWWGHR